VLVRLMYVSKARQPVTDAGLSAILRLATERNERFGITGFLNFNGWQFMQVIEGKPDPINQLAANIKRDRRHTNFTLLTHEQIQRRAFPLWTMQLLRTEHHGLPATVRDTRDSPTLRRIAERLPGRAAALAARYAAG
jgi:hypothetical protein